MVLSRMALVQARNIDSYYNAKQKPLTFHLKDYSSQVIMLLSEESTWGSDSKYYIRAPFFFDNQILTFEAFQLFIYYHSKIGQTSGCRGCKQKENSDVSNSQIQAFWFNS